MKKHFLIFAALALPLLPVSRLCAAINPAVVPADARWVVYADLNALRASVIGKELVSLIEKSEVAKVNTGAGKVGIDWQKLLATIGTATAYGTNLSTEPKDIDGALVVQGTADLRKIAESILIQINLAEPNVVAELNDLPFPAYVIKEPKPKAPMANPNGKSDATGKAAPSAAPMEVVIAFTPEPVIIVSKSKPQILKARDVVRGSAPSLATKANSPLKKFLSASDGAYLFTASTVPVGKLFPEDGPQGRILKMASAGSLAFGERGENTFAHSELIASDAQMAEKLVKILQGMTAMLSLAETNDKQLAEFLDSTVVKRNGDTVSLDLAYSSARLAQMVKLLQQPPQARGPDRGPGRLPPMVNGTALAEWQAEPGAAPAEGSPETLAWRTIENVALQSGTLFTLARSSTGRSSRYDRIEIVPANGNGAPLVFRPEFMRTAGARGNWAQFQFPGADGSYTLKVAYVNDPAGKASYAVSIKDLAPRPAPTPPPAPAAPKAK